MATRLPNTPTVVRAAYTPSASAESDTTCSGGSARDHQRASESAVRVAPTAVQRAATQHMRTIRDGKRARIRRAERKTERLHRAA